MNLFKRREPESLVDLEPEPEYKITYYIDDDNNMIVLWLRYRAIMRPGGDFYGSWNTVQRRTIALDSTSFEELVRESLKELWRYAEFREERLKIVGRVLSVTQAVEG